VKFYENNWVRFPVEAHYSLFHSVQIGLVLNEPPTQYASVRLLYGEIEWGVKVTTHLHLVLRLTINGDFSSLMT
jgi:hypothetical protein